MYCNLDICIEICSLIITTIFTMVFKMVKIQLTDDGSKYVHVSLYYVLELILNLCLFHIFFPFLLCHSQTSKCFDSHKKCVNSKGYTTLNFNYFSLKKCVYVTEMWINICIKCWWNKFYRFVVKRSLTKTLENTFYSKEHCNYYCYHFLIFHFYFTKPTR